MELYDLSVPLLWEDKKFIRRILNGQPDWIWEAAIRDYVLVWESASQAEASEAKKDNAGRRAANTFLRETVWPTLYANINSAA